jgi:hypothetical protein
MELFLHISHFVRKFGFVKRFAVILCLLGLFVAATPGQYEKYIEKYASVAVSEMHRSGVPASITLAQGLLESAAGESVLATKANNHFGIKCHSDWKGKKTYKDDDKENECFRVYPNASASFRDHSDFLRYQDRYKSLFDLEPTDYKAWAKGLKKAGYATDRQYADKLIKLIEDYELYRYDSDADIPETPHEIEKPVELKPSDVKEELRFSLSRDVYQINGVPCIYAVEGDTYESIAASYGLFLREILRFNDASSGAVLRPGDIVYLQIKKRRGARGMEKFIAGEGCETLRDISQRFGIRLSTLKRYNRVPEDYIPLEGDTILLRR